MAMPSGPIARGSVPSLFEKGKRKMRGPSTTSALAKMPVGNPTMMNFPASKKNKEGAGAMGGKKGMKRPRAPKKMPGGY